jgi:hypothetical protein
LSSRLVVTRCTRLLGHLYKPILLEPSSLGTSGQEIGLVSEIGWHEVAVKGLPFGPPQSLLSSATRARSRVPGGF